MELTNKQMVLECMVRIGAVQTQIENLALTCSFLNRNHKRPDSGNLRELLFDEEMKEWRNLCMWGLTLNDEERDRVKAAVHQRFLHDGAHVADWLNNGVSPGSWLSADEDEFRKMAKAAFLGSNP